MTEEIGMPRDPTDPERADIEYYEVLELDDLLGLVGRASDPIPGVQYLPEKAKAEGTAWLAGVREPVRRKICSEWGYCRRRSDPRFGDRATLIVAVADLLVGILGGVPAIMAATLLVRMSLDDLCGC